MKKYTKPIVLAFNIPTLNKSIYCDIEIEQQWFDKVCDTMTIYNFAEVTFDINNSNFFLKHLKYQIYKNENAEKITNLYKEEYGFNENDLNEHHLLEILQLNTLDHYIPDNFEFEIQEVRFKQHIEPHKKKQYLLNCTLIIKNINTNKTSLLVNDVFANILSI